MSIPKTAGHEGSNEACEEVMAQCCTETACCEEVKPYIGYDNEGHALRAEIKEVTAKVEGYIQTAKNIPPKRRSIITPTNDHNHSEMIKSTEHAYRNLQMAAMWLGKSIQAYNGGKSVLDKLTLEELAEFNARD